MPAGAGTTRCKADRRVATGCTYWGCPNQPQPNAASHSTHTKASAHDVGMQRVAGRLKPSAATAAVSQAAARGVTARLPGRRGAAGSRLTCSWPVCRHTRRAAGLGGDSRASAVIGVRCARKGEGKRKSQIGVSGGASAKKRRGSGKSRVQLPAR